jgi:hypothetical protein
MLRCAVLALTAAALVLPSPAGAAVANRIPMRVPSAADVTLARALITVPGHRPLRVRFTGRPPRGMVLGMYSRTAARGDRQYLADAVFALARPVGSADAGRVLTLHLLHGARVARVLVEPDAHAEESDDNCGILREPLGHDDGRFFWLGRSSGPRWVGFPIRQIVNGALGYGCTQDLSTLDDPDLAFTQALLAPATGGKVTWRNDASGTTACVYLTGAPGTSGTARLSGPAGSGEARYVYDEFGVALARIAVPPGTYDLSLTTARSSASGGTGIVIGAPPTQGPLPGLEYISVGGC